MNEEDGTSRNLKDLSSKVARDLSVLGQAIRLRSEELLDQLSTLTRSHPYGAVGLSFGAGFLLAGGLLSRATLRALRTGTRMAFGLLLQRTLEEMRRSPNAEWTAGRETTH